MLEQLVHRGMYNAYACLLPFLYDEQSKQRQLNCL